MEFVYQKIDPEILKKIRQLKELHNIFNQLMIRLRGDVEKSLEALKGLQRQGYIDEKISLEDFKKDLLKRGIIEEKVNERGRGVSFTKRGEFKLREQVFKEIFQQLKKGFGGDHQVSHLSGSRFEESGQLKAFEFGDEFEQIHYTQSLFNSIKKGSFDLQLEESDLEVNIREESTSMAIVLMIDISHSMILYGEDRITPAKELAMALTHLITTKFPKDDISVILFGDDAIPININELSKISVGPYHTNTQMGLRKARERLSKKKQSYKQIIMITDGKPSMIKLANGKYYKNSFGLDPEIVSRTLDEAILCRKKNIFLTTFMLTDDPYLKNFIHKLTKVSKGKAFYSSVDNLGKFILEDFISNRKRLLR